jgi:hypothetical protein
MQFETNESEEDNEEEDDDEEVQEDPQEDEVKKKGRKMASEEIPQDSQERALLKEESETMLAKLNQLMRWLVKWPIAFYDYGNVSIIQSKTPPVLMELFQMLLTLHRLMNNASSPDSFQQILLKPLMLEQLPRRFTSIFKPSLMKSIQHAYHYAPSTKKPSHWRKKNAWRWQKSKRIVCWAARPLRPT